jgi:hypothetical protein
MTPHAQMHRACGRNDTECTMHAATLTLHAFKIFFAYNRRFANDFHFSKLFENFIVHAVSF